MDEINKKEEEWISLQDMDFSNEFDKYIRDLEDRRKRVDDLIN